MTINPHHEMHRRIFLLIKHVSKSTLLPDSEMMKTDIIAIPSAIQWSLSPNTILVQRPSNTECIPNLGSHWISSPKQKAPAMENRRSSINNVPWPEQEIPWTSSTILLITFYRIFKDRINSYDTAVYQSQFCIHCATFPLSKTHIHHTNIYSSGPDS